MRPATVSNAAASFVLGWRERITLSRWPRTLHIDGRACVGLKISLDASVGLLQELPLGRPLGLGLKVRISLANRGESRLSASASRPRFRSLIWPTTVSRLEKGKEIGLTGYGLRKRKFGRERDCDCERENTMGYEIPLNYDQRVGASQVRMDIVFLSPNECRTPSKCQARKANLDAPHCIQP